MIEMVTVDRLTTSFTNAIVTDTGEIIDTGEYLPYGQDREPNGLLQTTSYKFTDQEQDDGTGLYNYDARLYDPEIGQFIMADTLVPDMFNPQSLNRYAYCLNNPIRYVDPSGHIGDDCGTGTNGGLFGGMSIDLASIEVSISFASPKALMGLGTIAGGSWKRGGVDISQAINGSCVSFGMSYSLKGINYPSINWSGYGFLSHSSFF